MNKWANTVLTDKGLALMAKLTQGNTLNITKAVTGAGFVTPGVLSKQTEITDPKQTMAFKPVSYPETGKCAITVELTNEGLTTGYDAKQVGLYAEDPDEGEILLLITQTTDEQSGTVIPSETEMPGYSAEWTFYLQYGQADSVTVTVAPTNTVSYKEMEEFVNNEFSSRTTVYSQNEEPTDAEDNSVWVDLDEGETDGGETADEGVMLPVVTDEDNGKLLSVVLGEWRAASVTAKQVGAAPAGYGLGEAEPFSIADIDNVVKPGFYSSVDSATVGGYHNSRWWMLVTAHGNGAYFVTQELHSFKTTNGVNLVRHRLNGTWTEWEFKDPIMELATEYRTTERFSMTPIYKQAIYLGAMTAGGTKTVEHGITITGYPIDCKLFDTTGAIFDLVSFTETDITVAAPDTYWGHGAYAILSYVK